jgi:hypothetical protein
MKDVDGRQRYVDTGDLVFDIPLMEELPEPKVPVDKQFTSERELRMEYTKQAQPFINRRRSIGQIIEQGELARNETNPIAQRAVIFAMFKLWDEGSTVHTTEQEQIEKARSPLNLKAAWRQLWGGEILTDTQIDQLQRTAQVSMISDARIQKDLEAQFQGIADEYGLSRTAAVPDFIGDEWRNIKLKATDALVEDYGQRLGTKDSQTILDAMEKDGVVID